MSRNLAYWIAVASLCAITVAACGDAGDAESATPETPTSTAPPTSTTDAVGDDVGGLDFVKGSEVDLGDGWVLSPCESGPPLFCARHGGETQAVIELLSAPAASYGSMKKVLDAGGAPLEALRAEAAEFVSVFEEDRPEGCGASYDVQPFGPESATVAGMPGIVYGFDGKQSGRHVERALQFMTIDGSTVHLIGINAVDDGTCMDDDELAEFTTAELTELEPKIRQVIAASTLP